MKKYLLLFLILLCGCGATYTTNYSLTKPESGDTGWADDVNTNFDTIDSQMKTNADAIDTKEDTVTEGSLANDTITEAELKAVDSPADEECLTYESTVGDFEWQSCAASSAPTDADYLVGTADGDLSAEIVVGTTPGGELGGTWASPTIDDSVTVTGWVLGTSSATQLTSPTIITDLIDGNGAVDMDYGSLDITDHTFITDSTGDGEIVLPDDSIGPSEMASGAYDLGTSLEADTLTEGGNAVYNSTETPGGELGGTWASPTIDDSVSVSSWTITTPIFSGAADFDGGTVDDDDCTGQIGLMWFDDTDNAFEFCESDSGTPTTVSSTGAFSDASDPIVQNTTGKDVHIGDGAGTLTGKMEIGGDADQPQLVVEGHSTQTDSIFIIQQDDDTEIFSVDEDGTVTMSGTGGGSIYLEEQADALADTVGYGQYWVNTATPNEPYFTDDAGNDRALAWQGGDIGAATATTPSASDNDTSVATTAFVQTELAGNVPDTNHHWRISIFDGNGAGITTNSVIPIGYASAALTVTAINVTTSSASYNIAGDLKRANNRHDLTDAEVINPFDTTSGILDDSSMASGLVTYGKFIYLQFDSAPDASDTDDLIDVQWDYN